jgi:hypothetical protein
MKFMDIATQTGSIAYFTESSGNVNKEKFIKWWFTDYETIISEIPGFK